MYFYVVVIPNSLNGFACIVIINEPQHEKPLTITTSSSPRIVSEAYIYPSQRLDLTPRTRVSNSMISDPVWDPWLERPEVGGEPW